MEATFHELLTEVRELAAELAIAACETQNDDIGVVALTLSSLAERFAPENRRQWSQFYEQAAG